VEFYGEFYTVPRSRIGPKPLQLPRPPLTIGGYAKGVLRRAAALADGYNGGNIAFLELAPLLKELARAAESAGKDPASLRVICRGSYAVHEVRQGPSRRPLRGTRDEIREDIRRYAAMGVTELFLEANFQPGGADVDQVLRDMEGFAPQP
jgi:alkanesulfonate monooxygenase SsuD/methylene tetrahydromethanopterin reductase-like flavin-dependent oxidoreductase (luciferase family)